MVGLRLIIVILTGFTCTIAAPKSLNSQTLKPTKYLPKIKRKGFEKAQYTEISDWLEKFNKEQEKYCGVPAVPIEFPKKQDSFEPVSSTSWPWMVSLYKTPSLLNRFFDLYPEQFKHVADKILREDYQAAVSEHKCGGTVISPNFVLTAAHCLLYRSFDEIDPEYEASAQLNQFIERCQDADMTMETCLEALGSFSELYQLAGRDFWQDTFVQALKGIPLNKTGYWQLWIGAPQRSGYSDDLSTEKLIKVRVKKIIAHPKAKDLVENAQHGDLALLQLEKPITDFTDTVRPICLTHKKITKHRRLPIQCAVAGWGVYFDDDGKPQFPDLLEAAPYKMVPNTECRKKASKYDQFRYSPLKRPISAEQFCAIERNSQKKKTPGIKTKLCYGDSGGPLVCKYPDGRWYQLGITSYGKSLTPESCEISRAPDVFTNVPGFMDWIVTTLYEHDEHK